ncbi:MAG: hypothetical protein HOP29_10660 [Phycisphaerales bacterium]|nr:hypothetical protein [Phycisphaerales bacterium]
MNTRMGNISFMSGESSSCRRMCRLLAAGLVTVVAGPQASQGALPFNATITADNGYAYGLGTVNGIGSDIRDFMPGPCQAGTCVKGPKMGASYPGCPNGLYGDCSGVSVENCTLAAEIFNCAGGPETYSHTKPGNFYIYIAAWSDDSVLQGVLARFEGNQPGATIGYSGAGWEVFATGIDHDCPPAGGPSRADINTQVGLANTLSGGPGSSVGWVDTLGGTSGSGLEKGVLVVGEPNAPTGGVFPQVCPNESQNNPQLIDMTDQPRWMWYNAHPDPADPQYISDAFTMNPPGGGGHREYLIFRIQLSALRQSAGIPTVSEWGLLVLLLSGISMGTVLFGRRRMVPG